MSAQISKVTQAELNKKVRKMLALANEIKEVMDKTRQKDYLDAYVWGQLSSDEFGYCGEGCLDILQKEIDNAAEEELD